VTTTLSPESKHALVRHLAWFESPCRPLRHDYTKGGAAHAARSRANYGDGGDARRRKVNQRLRAELVAAGLLDRNGLTFAGKMTARCWTWPYTKTELLEALNRVDFHTTAGDCRAGGCVPETLIAGSRSGESSEPFAALQALLIPAVADGAIEAHSDVFGHAFYKLVVDWPNGQGRLAVANEPDIDAELADAFLAEYRAVWRGILKDKKKYQEIGAIPIPVSGELVSRRDPDDVTGIQPLFADV
jgi:hypothetical protein